MKVKDLISIILVELFLVTQFGFYFPSDFYTFDSSVRRVKSLMQNPIGLIIRQAETEVAEAITASSDSEKTEHIHKASEYFREVFGYKPYNPSLVSKLKSWLEDASSEKQLLASLVLVNLSDQQGMTEEERLACLEKIKQYQYWVYRPESYKDRVDLHTHTFRSDGSATPAGIVLQAWQEGMKAIGVVDHNTFSHIYEAVRAGEILGIDVTPGVEFDVYDFDRGIKNMHVVAYFDKGSSEEYKAWLDSLQGTEMFRELEELKSAYIKKLYQMVENFNQKKLEAKDGSGEILTLSIEDLRGFITDTPNKYQLGMALLAKYGKEKLRVSTYKEATRKYFSDKAEWHWQEGEELGEVRMPDGKLPTYIKISPDGIRLDEILKFAVAQGGTLILPHPGEFLASKDQTTVPLSREEKLEIYRKLLEDYAVIEVNGEKYLGIRGVELYSSKNTPEDIEEIATMMEDLNANHPIYRRYPLIATAGTDTHSMVGQGVELCIGKGNIPWIATTYITYDKLKYQMGLVESIANAERILQELGLGIPVVGERYLLGEYAYWAKRILETGEEVNRQALEAGLPLLLQHDGDFRHLDVKSKMAVINGLGYLMEKTGRSAEELINQALQLAAGVSEGSGRIPYSYFITPQNRLNLAQSMGISKYSLMGDLFRAWINRNGGNLFLTGQFGLTAGLMALFAQILNLSGLLDMGTSGISLFAGLEALAAPFFFKVSELVNKFLAGKLTPQLILPEEDLSTYGFERSLIPAKGKAIFVYNLGSTKNREAFIEETLEANPGIPIVLFTYTREDKKLDKMIQQVEKWNEKYGTGYPGGKAVIVVSQANPWWEGPNPGPKHGNLEDLAEWLADMDRGYEATNPDYQDELAEIRGSGKTIDQLSEEELKAMSGRPEVTFFDENFNPTDEPPTLEKVKEIALSGKNSTEQIKNFFRMLYGAMTGSEDTYKGQLPLWYTAPVDKENFKSREEAEVWAKGLDPNWNRVEEIKGSYKVTYLEAKTIEFDTEEEAKEFMRNYTWSAIERRGERWEVTYLTKATKSFDSEQRAKAFVEGLDYSEYLHTDEQRSQFEKLCSEVKVEGGKGYRVDESWTVKYRHAYFHPEYIKRDFRWVTDENGRGKIIEETWAVWVNPQTGEKTYVRDRRVLFDNITADIDAFRNLLAMIPLDGDSSVPMDPETGVGHGIRLLAKALCPVNQPVVDEETMLVKEGYGIIQPLQIIGNVDKTQWTETMARERIRMMFDQQGQMSLLGSGVDYGKNLKFIRDAQGRGVAGWILKATGRGTRGGRRNFIKPSPDIGEGAFLSPAFALDLVFKENEQPTNYVVDYMRSGKWGTGDVINSIQDTPGFLPWMVNAQGVWVKSPYSLVDRFRILSNAVGIGTNITYPFWMGLWAISAFLGWLGQTGVINPALGGAMFASTAGMYILLSKVLPVGKRFALGDFVRTQTLLSNVLKIPPIVAKGVYRFLTGKELVFASTGKYQKQFEKIGLKDIYLWHNGKPGILFWPAITGAGITGLALGFHSTPWLTWGSLLTASLISSGLLTYFTGRDKSKYAQIASKIETGPSATGYRMLGDAWAQVAQQNMTTKASRIKDVLETYVAFKELIQDAQQHGSYKIAQIWHLAHLVKNPTLFAKVTKDYFLTLVELRDKGEEASIECLQRAIWDNLTENEKAAFIEITGDEDSAKKLFFGYIDAIYTSIYQEEVATKDEIVKQLGIKEAVEERVGELKGLLSELGISDSEIEAQRRIDELVSSTVEDNPDISGEEMLRVIDRSIAGVKVWLEFQQWLRKNPDAMPYDRLEKLNELFNKYGLLFEEDNPLYRLNAGE